LIADLSKWASKTGMRVEHLCKKANAPCIGFGLCFLDPFASPEEKYRFIIELAYDPHFPPNKEEREKIDKALRIATGAIAAVFEGMAAVPDEKQPTIQ
jgi:hypothetical protein